MAKKISQLTQATQVKSDDVTVIVQDGETKKLPLNMMVTKQDIENKKVAGLAKLDEIEATYENDTYTPTITVKNKSSVKVGEGDGVDYSANVMDGPAKSAILTGQTLVNHATDNLYITVAPLGVETITQNMLALKNNTEYIAIFRMLIGSDTSVYLHLFNNNWEFVKNFSSNLSPTKNYIKFTTPSSSEIKHLQLENKGASSFDITDVMVIEYEDGMENWDIPYFEGMQSVKMPVLTTTGKNLFNKGNMLINCALDADTGEIIENWANFNTSDFIKVEKNRPIFIPSAGSSRKVLYDINKKYVKNVSFSGDKVFVADVDGYIRVTMTNIDYDSFQIEYGTQATSYEPYKTNTLTTPEDLELRGIGNVKDELNVATGELTQRIGEIVFNSSDGFNYLNNQDDGNFSSFEFTKDINRKPGYNGEICDKLKRLRNYLTNENGIYYYSNDGRLELRLDTTNFISRDLNGLNDYLSKNPITLQYFLATPTIKTVVLNPSGTLASETPYMWKNGSIQLSSDGLVPGLDYAVTTSRVGVIENNMNETITNEKRIHALEVILAQSTIAAAADAVSLQSDLESTTMSTDGAQLETENTQDNFLYEMILLLIENNAHDESLFDKVCMFYLYGKLSDEQFTNIYNLLYPVNPEEE